MFMDANIACCREGGNQRDDDGAKRVFFGGERFIEGISGQAYVMKICHFKLIPIYLDSYRVHIFLIFYVQITVQRTELNSPLGLEVQLHVTEAVCPALSEPGNDI
jgi:hypothetical protein